MKNIITKSIISVAAIAGMLCVFRTFSATTYADNSSDCSVTELSPSNAYPYYFDPKKGRPDRYYPRKSPAEPFKKVPGPKPNPFKKK